MDSQTDNCRIPQQLLHKGASQRKEPRNSRKKVDFRESPCFFKSSLISEFARPSSSAVPKGAKEASIFEDWAI